MSELTHELRILEEIERDPDVTQGRLAVQLGVAVGSVNWYLKRLIEKGYVKVTHLQRRKLHYFLTPSGIALKVKLTHSYMDVSLRVYRELRQAAQRALAEVAQVGHSSVFIEGDDEAAEILRLTCLEHGLKVSIQRDEVPILRSNGIDFAVTWPDVHSNERGESA